MKNNIEKIRHSLAHLLGASILELYPGSKITLGPAIENGFYYDVDVLGKITDSDLQNIESKMRELAKSWKGFDKKILTKEEALEFFKGNEYKIELINEIANKGEEITIYTSGNFSDLCRGGHVDDINDINLDAFKLDKIAGAYWRGDEKNKMLTRVYGLAFSTKDELEAYLTQQEEAKKRDHKILGKELDLFTFSELIGSGLPLWTPKGTLIRNLLDDYVWELRKKFGYLKVEIPHITKKDLYITSGHWDKFKDELFKINTREGHEFAMKPMNCPHHTQIYARRAWSYRELPQRYANTTTCYRDEQTGELSGLSRVRAFAQDDAHVFCRMNQAKEEFLKIWDIIYNFYPSFGFDLEVRLSTHDKNHMEKYLGSEERWEQAENILKEIIKEKKVHALDGLGEAAFYGPKLDFMAKDSLGRRWQVATIQLDMNMPERFDLTCSNEKGEKERIVMLHAAIMGSIERFLSILIEHTMGNFPTWLSPTQVIVLPVSEHQREYASDIYNKLKEQDIRVEIDDSNESLGKRIRNAKMQKSPYLIVVGDKEKASGNITIEARKEKLENWTTEKFIEKIKLEIKEKTLN